MKSLIDTLNESKTSPREIQDYIHSWFYNCSDIRELKVFFNSLIAGMNEGLDDMNRYNSEDVELCETASEVIEKFENICKITLK